MLGFINKKMETLAKGNLEEFKIFYNTNIAEYSFFLEKNRIAKSELEKEIIEHQEEKMARFHKILNTIKESDIDKDLALKNAKLRLSKIAQELNYKEIEDFLNN